MNTTQKMYADIMSHPEMQALDKWYRDNYETAALSKINFMDKIYIKTYERIEIELSE